MRAPHFTGVRRVQGLEELPPHKEALTLFPEKGVLPLRSLIQMIQCLMYRKVETKMVEQIDGAVTYIDTAQQAYLNNGEGASLLLFDRPPLGLAGPEDVAGAYQHLRAIIGAQPGQAIRVLGIKGGIGTQKMIWVVRFS